MVAIGKSTSVSLLYVERPNLSFAHCVDVIDAALGDTGYAQRTVTWGGDEFVSFDVEGSRVTLGRADLDIPETFEDGTPAGYRTLLVVAVGPGPRRGAARNLAEDGRVFCDAIIERLREGQGADLILWTETTGVFTAANFECLIDTALTMRPTNAQPIIQDRFTEPPIGRLMDRLSVEIPSRSGIIRLHAIPPASGSDTPSPEDTAAPDTAGEAGLLGLPANSDLGAWQHPMRAEMARIRSALYPPSPERPQPKKGPLAQRLTLYTFNTTLMMVSMPLGAALLTYNVLGREDTRLTARVMALTGVALAFGRTIFGPEMDLMSAHLRLFSA